MANYANLPAPTPEGGLNRYMQEIRKFPLLEPEEEEGLRLWLALLDPPALLLLPPPLLLPLPRRLRSRPPPPPSSFSLRWWCLLLLLLLCLGWGTFSLTGEERGEAAGLDPAGDDPRDPRLTGETPPLWYCSTVMIGWDIILVA